MMSRLKLIAAEAVRSLGANLSTTFAATTTVLIGMFMLGLVVGLGSWALSLSDHYKKQLLVNVYFCTDLRCGSAIRWLWTASICFVDASWLQRRGVQK